MVLGVTLITLIVSGCGHSYHEKQLIGSWKLGVNVADARVTYYPNHTWVMTLTSADTNIITGAEFGDWKLDGDRLETVTRTTLRNAAASTHEVVKIVRAEASILVWKAKDPHGIMKVSTLRKTDAPSAPLSDSEYAQLLEGTWRFSYTNGVKSAGALVFSTYRPDGKALWHGTAYKEAQSQPMPNATGV